MTDKTEFIKQFISDEAKLSVVVEDDGRVAYAYLLGEENHIVGDVWLYNRCGAPREPEWTTLQAAPFANSAEFVKLDASFVCLKYPDVDVQWIWESCKWIATIWANGRLIAKLGEGDKPGMSALALQDGPLAKVLDF